MPSQTIVGGYARMWPREVFFRFPALKSAGTKRKIALAKDLDFLEKPGVYILYRDDEPYYIGQATKLRDRLWATPSKQPVAIFISGTFSPRLPFHERNRGTSLKEFLSLPCLPPTVQSREFARKECQKQFVTCFGK